MRFIHFALAMQNSYHRRFNGRQLDDPHAGRGLHRMTAVGDDEHIGGPGGGAEQHSQESGRKQAPLRYRWVGYGSWHVEPP